MKEMATMPRPTTTIFFLEFSLDPGPGLPSTGSPYRSPSRTGMTGYWSMSDEQHYEIRSLLHFKRIILDMGFAKGATRGEYITKTNRA